MVALRLKRNFLWATGYGPQFVSFLQHTSFSTDSLGMMPESSEYGPWPASGEIDIMEGRGNDVEYEMGGRDVFVSTLHWGLYHETFIEALVLTYSRANSRY
jgi:hypothetical protein